MTPEREKRIRENARFLQAARAGGDLETLLDEIDSLRERVQRAETKATIQYQRAYNSDMWREEAERRERHLLTIVNDEIEWLRSWSPRETWLNSHADALKSKLASIGNILATSTAPETSNTVTDSCERGDSNPHGFPH